MDAAKFKEDLDAARQCAAPVVHREQTATLQLRLPTPFAWRVAVERNRDDEGRTITALAFRELVEAAVIGWEGVTVRWINPAGGDDLLPFSKANLALLLDYNEDVQDAVTVAIGEQRMRRREQLEEATKN